MPRRDRACSTLSGRGKRGPCCPNGEVMTCLLHVAWPSEAQRVLVNSAGLMVWPKRDASPDALFLHTFTPPASGVTGKLDSGTRRRMAMAWFQTTCLDTYIMMWRHSRPSSITSLGRRPTSRLCQRRHPSRPRPRSAQGRQLALHLQRPASSSFEGCSRPGASPTARD